jgi:hypothetical protein
MMYLARDRIPPRGFVLPMTSELAGDNVGSPVQILAVRS